jgi:2',3'-cyclic-nucleotide 2'-phosphodiesterase / 3'-nucleotidase / 5'-nucleotidase
MRFCNSVFGLLVVAAAPISNVAAQLSLNVLGSFQHGPAFESASEIVDYDPCEEVMYVVNSGAESIDVVDIKDPSNPVRTSQLFLPPALIRFSPTSVVVIPFQGVIATANDDDSDDSANGIVAFFDTTKLVFLGSIIVGNNPDMITITPNGKYLLVANEGPVTDTVDPDGTISVVDLSKGIAAVLANPSMYVSTINFNSLDAAPLIAAGVRIQAGKTASQDLEPEYIAVTPDSKLAFVSLQENNAIAKLNLTTKPPSLVTVFPLTPQNHANVLLDPSDEDKAPTFRTLNNLFGMPMPDAIAAYKAKDGKVYVVTANEGDARDGEEERIANLLLDNAAFPSATEIQQETFFGRLLVSNRVEDKNGNGEFERLLAYGTRSFSIYDANGVFVFDSGSQFEALTLTLNPPGAFNSDGTLSSFDKRSDNKGPEPEAVDVGEIDGRMYAFIGLERIGGIMVYDVTVPAKSFFVTYVNNRNFDILPGQPGAGDIAPETIKFVDKGDSPTGNYMLLVANEVSGTTTIYDIASSFSAPTKGKGGKGRSLTSAATLNQMNGGRTRGGGSAASEGGQIRELKPKGCKKKRRA